MSKVAIAGSGGLARCIAECIRYETSYSFIILSQTPNEALASTLQCQVMAVDYGNLSELEFALQGIDTVISTIPDQSQINLIDAAAMAKVRRFVPSEFEGSPSLRMHSSIARDQSKNQALERLRHYSSPRQDYQMQYTSFVCGVFYERFGPNGLSSRGIGRYSGIYNEGSYLMNLRAATSEIPYQNGSANVPLLCMTAVNDVARFVVQALEMSVWPAELHMYGERMSVLDIVRCGEQLKGVEFEKYYSDTISLMDRRSRAEDYHEYYRIQQFIDTAEGRFDSQGPFLLNIGARFSPIRFQDWLRVVWAGQ